MAGLRQDGVHLPPRSVWTQWRRFFSDFSVSSGKIFQLAFLYLLGGSSAEEQGDRVLSVFSAGKDFRRKAN